jgi:hypothetical protein
MLRLLSLLGIASCAVAWATGWRVSTKHFHRRWRQLEDDEAYLAVEVWLRKNGAVVRLGASGDRLRKRRRSERLQSGGSIYRALSGLGRIRGKAAVRARGEHSHRLGSVRVWRYGPLAELPMKCACGWKGDASEMPAYKHLGGQRVCPECGASGGVVMDSKRKRTERG